MKKTKTQIIDIPGPLWSVKPGELHPELARVTAIPFLAGIAIDDKTEGHYFTLNGKKEIHDGLHKRMHRRFFRKYKKKHRKITKKTRRFPSTKKDGAEAGGNVEAFMRGDGVLDDMNPYAIEAINWWIANGHQLQASEIPVVLPHARIITRGDFFTVKHNTETNKDELWLWELKTGYPHVPRHPIRMASPLITVHCTPWNIYQLQLLFTRMAYERELEMKIDHSRVIHVWKERAKDKSFSYKCAVYAPPKWVEEQDLDLLYRQI
jgi:hypothetical protein